MLELRLPPLELYNDKTNEFIETKERVIQLEHSLISISKWESKWNKPFLGKDKKHEKTEEESLDYIRCMCIAQKITPAELQGLDSNMIKMIQDYIGAPMSATTINDKGPKKTNREIITSEIIYYWMIAHNIPFECQKWHLNRLLTLISVCNIKNAPEKGSKMSKKQLASRNSALNAARRQQLGTKG